MVIVSYNWDPLVDDRGTYVMPDNLLGVSHTTDSYGWIDTCSESLIVNPLDGVGLTKLLHQYTGRLVSVPWVRNNCTISTMVTVARAL